MTSVVVDILFWLAVFFGTSGLLFTMVYCLILFADLTVDHINPIELCDRINLLIWPEYTGHTAITLLFLLRGFWTCFILNIPLLLVHVVKWIKKRHKLDSTTIFLNLKKETRVAEIKLGFYMLMFFVYLYYFILSLIIERGHK